MQVFILILLLSFQFKIVAEGDDNEKNLEATTNAAGQHEIDSGDTFTKCYDELGCLTTDQTWFHEKFRPVNFRPLDRHVIKTEFILIRKNKTTGEKNDMSYQVITSTENSIKSAGFIHGKFLFLLIHDFTSNGYAGWIRHISKLLKSRTKACNIISVDWHAGAEPPYDLAIANARVVSLEIIAFLKFLKENNQITLGQVHSIGHGVGAHIAGYVGYTIQTHKITGLDPSGPRFEGMPIHVRLDVSDAIYVEVLHTDAMQQNSQGTKQILGHTDFFINNAELQPGCPLHQKIYDLLSVTRGMLSGGEILPGCSHKRAYKYYIESLEIKECTFLGIKCASYSDFRQGKCSSCGQNCRTFGLVRYPKPNNGSYFLQTDSKHPFCLYQYRVTVRIVGNSKSVYYGYFEFIMIDKSHYTTTSSMLEPREFKPGEDQFVFYAEVPEMRRIVEARVGWFTKPKKFCLINCKQAINVEKVSIQSLNSNTKYSQEVSLCPKENLTEIRSGDFQDFTLCIK